MKILIHPYLQQPLFHQPLPFHEKNLTPSFSGKFRNEGFQLRVASLYLTLTLSAHVLFYIYIYISLYLYIYLIYLRKSKKPEDSMFHNNVCVFIIIPALLYLLHFAIIT